MRELKTTARGADLSGEMNRLIERLDLKHVPRAPRFFYPYEVQILDLASHEDNELGRSAHSEYKKSQIQTAMRRVMGPLAESR